MRLRARSFVLACLLACPQAIAQSPPAPGAPLPEIMRQLAQAPERRAAFREVKRLAALDAPLHSNGTLHYRQPGYLEKLTLFPNRERLVVDGDRLVITPGDEPPRVVDLGGQPALRALIDAVRAPMAGDLATLQRAFEVETAAAPGGWRLSLTPRDPAAARLVRQVRIVVEGADVTSVEIAEAGGDEQLLLIDPAR